MVWLILQVAIGVVFSFIPFLFKFLLPLVNLVGVILWVILMVKASQGEYFLLPVLGKMAMDNSEIK